jgi:hypothetical protein
VLGRSLDPLWLLLNRHKNSGMGAVSDSWAIGWARGSDWSKRKSGKGRERKELVLGRSVDPLVFAHKRAA